MLWLCKANLMLSMDCINKKNVRADIICWGFMSQLHLRPYQDGHRLETVCIYGNFIVLLHWEISLLSSWPYITPSLIIIRLRKPTLALYYCHGVMTMGNIQPRVGTEPTSLAFHTNVLTITPPKLPDVTILPTPTCVWGSLLEKLVKTITSPWNCKS